MPLPDPPLGTPARPAICNVFPVETRSINSDTRWAPYGASAAPAGAVVFHRYLQQLNNEHRIDAARRPDPAEHCPHKPFRRSIEDTFEPTKPASASNAPTIGGPGIGKVSPVTPEHQARAVTEVVFQQRTPITGRMIDIIA